jgi:type II secretory pathway component PulF
MSATAGSGGLTLEQWLALNDTISAMVRAGLPLERCLMDVGTGRLSDVSRSIAIRLERGESLEQALEAEGDHVPPVYRAVVKAGARSGQLASALDGLTVYARHFVEMRRTLGLALVYPVLVILLAYVLFLGFLLFVLPRFLAVFESFRFSSHESLTVLDTLRRTAAYWAPVFPALLVLALLSWAWSGRARSFPRFGRCAPLAWVPGMRGMLRQVAASSFAELLAVLVEAGTPLPEAIELAARSTGDRGLSRAVEELARDLREGLPLKLPARRNGGFPAMLAWLMAYGARQGRLATALRHAAGTYRRRASLRAETIRTILPTLAMIVLGATITAVYALTLFLPFSNLLKQIAGDI